MLQEQEDSVLVFGIITEILWRRANYPQWYFFSTWSFPCFNSKTTNHTFMWPHPREVPWAKDYCYPVRFSIGCHLNYNCTSIKINLSWAIKRIKFLTQQMSGAIFTKGTFTELILYKTFTSVTSASIYPVIPPEPESFPTPPYLSPPDPCTNTSS